MLYEQIYPFSAIVDQKKAKKALILNTVNPKIGGALLSGEKGSAKSTMVRGLGNILPDSEVINLPLNITEDRLIGTIDIEKAITEGERYFEAGLLKKADGNILYVDEANLLSDHIVNSLLDVAQSGVNKVEREGISYSHKAEFVLVGTMNPEEGFLRPQFLDRFGLFVEIKGEKKVEDRKRVIARRLEYEKNPEKFCVQYRESDAVIREKIIKGRDLLNKVDITDNIAKMAVEISEQGNCQGHRAELIMVETARAIAALDQRRHISLNDLKEAAEFVLPHRTRSQPSPKQKPQSQHNEEDNPEQEENKKEDQTEKEETNQEQKEDNQSSGEKVPPQSGADGKNNSDESSTNTLDDDQNYIDNSKDKKEMLPLQEKVEESGELFKVKSIQIDPFNRQERKGSGQRSRTRTSSRQGRYIKYMIPQGKVADLAFDATLKIAALNQKQRQPSNMAIVIKKSDFRDKVREKRVGNSLLFVVDASGSMGAKERMKATKAAILSLLNDAYQKRDEVGLVAFRQEKAECLLDITRSIEFAYKCMKELPTGGKTPLAAGLLKGYEILKARMIKDPDIIPVLILVSDCRPNVASQGGDPVQEAKEICSKIRAAGINSLLIDTEDDFIELGIAKKLAAIMEGQYYKLTDLKAEELEKVVRGYLQNN